LGSARSSAGDPERCGWHAATASTADIAGAAAEFATLCDQPAGLELGVYQW
jgi:hypothetical protein